MTWVYIIGGGVAGLSLAEALARYPSLPGEVVISEPRLHYQNDKTFSFWLHESQPLNYPELTQYKSWVFSREDTEISHQGNAWRYCRLPSADFYQRALERIHAHEKICIEHAHIEQKPSADFIFDSRPPRIETFTTVQSFVGIEFRCVHGLALNQARLMTEMRIEDGIFLFNYILPISENELLVEVTAFDRHPIEYARLEREVHDWMMGKGLQGLELRREQGQIPMGLQLDPDEDHLGMPIGARGGMTRAASGYGWLNMRAWATRTAESLISGHKIRPYRTPRLQSWMDQQLLRIIQQRSDLLPEIFMKMAAKLSPDQLAGFMSDASPRHLLPMILGAPPRPFIYSVMNRLSML